MALTESMAVTAQRRFGFGVSPNLLAQIGSDPRSYVLGQLDGPAYKDMSGLAGSDDLLRQMRVWQIKVHDAKVAANGDKSIEKVKNDFVKARLQDEVAYKQDQAIVSAHPFFERLTGFWSDHFCVACSKGELVKIVAGAYEREAIRPFVTGRFRDMLGAVMHHPAMLAYLDNNTSVGPNSKVGMRTGKGLNENLGRELMELHTVGVNAGYSQADVTNAARIITGWGISDAKKPDGGRFVFDPHRHEPGTFTVMGKSFAEAGQSQGEALLDMLAAHPATANHIAGKLVRHFIGDHAPQSITKAVAKRFQETGGDLKATVAALVEEDSAWSAPPAKVIPPFDMVIAAQRLTRQDVPVKQLMNMTYVLGQQVWTPRSPNGFPDNDLAWAAPNSIVKRFDWAMQFSGHAVKTNDPMQLANAAFGPDLNSQLTVALKRAASRPEALATLIMSPDIQVR
jgi:uncharacterized protein (DUF1800 family)